MKNEEKKDGCLCERKLIPGVNTIKSRRALRTGTGYEIDLYLIGGVPQDIARNFERRFAHLVD